MRRFWVVMMVMSVLVLGVAAQDAPAAEEVVQVEASDGLALVGALHRPAELAEGGAPALLLMHQNQSRRASWEPLIPTLTEAGYVVLAVDLRGHGETGGRADWALAQDDTQRWLAYLQTVEGVNPEQLATLGASIGSNLALVGCAANEACVTAVALSPGLDYFGVQPEAAVSDGLRRRSALLVASRSDSDSAEAVRQMAGSSGGPLGVRVYTGFSHGTELFEDHGDGLRALIGLWLAEAFAE
jgi:acetyl esterase/lipase